MNIEYDIDIPVKKRLKQSMNRHLVVGFLNSKKKNMHIEFDSDYEAKKFVGFVHSHKEFKLDASQTGVHVYVWFVKEE